MEKYGCKDPTQLKGIVMTSKNKHSRAKRYYAKDHMAFLAWEILGYNHEDHDYQKWLDGKVV